MKFQLKKTHCEIDGFLVLPVIGLFVAPLLLGSALWGFQVFFEEGVSGQILEGKTLYHESIQAYIFSNIAVEALAFLLNLLLIVLFFKRSPRFPLLLILQYFFFFSESIMNLVWYNKFADFGFLQMLLFESWHPAWNVLATAVLLFIGGGYMLFSPRVRCVFGLFQEKAEKPAES
jgi:hypothetical protein